MKFHEYFIIVKQKTPNGKSEFYLRKGLYELAHHNPSQALVFLRKSVEIVPPSCEEELSRSLYWLSIALLHMDQRDLALKSLANAQKLRRQSYARKFYLRNINEYGMVKRPTRELDDLYAFMSIQISSYLVKRSNHRFHSEAERSTILRLILDAWKRLAPSEEFKDLACGEKLQLFKKLAIDFPLFDSFNATLTLRERQQLRAEKNGSQACSCGSGLRYMQCCGRVPGLSEL